MKKIFWLWTFALVVKLALAAWLPMTSDEAYYWVWSHHLQLSYFDHPAMVAWLFWLGHGLEHFGQAVRWPAVILAHLTILVWLIALKPYMSPRQLFWFFILFLFNPMTGPGSLIVTPDLPLLFFWGCAILCFRKLLDTQHWRWYALLGLSLGLGFSSKYQIVIFAPILLVWIVWNRMWYLCRWPKVSLTILCGLLGSAPVLVWNARHHFVSFDFQLHHGLAGGTWSPWWTASYFGAQFLLIFPPLFILAALKAFRSRPSWLSFFAWGPLIFFAISSFKARTEANWPLAAYPAVLALAVMADSSSRWLKISFVTWATMLIVALTQIVYPWIPELAHTDWHFNESAIYSKVEEKAKNHRPFYVDSYELASWLSYDLKQPIAKLRGIGRPDFYDGIAESWPMAQTYFLAAGPDTELPRALLDRGDRIIKATPIDNSYELFEVQQR